MTKQAAKKVLSKADFMQLKTSVKSVEIPELGEVYIKVMTAVSVKAWSVKCKKK